MSNDWDDFYPTPYPKAWLFKHTQMICVHVSIDTIIKLHYLVLFWYNTVLAISNRSFFCLNFILHFSIYLFLESLAFLFNLFCWIIIELHYLHKIIHQIFSKKKKKTKQFKIKYLKWLFTVDLTYLRNHITRSSASFWILILSILIIYRTFSWNDVAHNHSSFHSKRFNNYFTKQIHLND